MEFLLFQAYKTWFLNELLKVFIFDVLMCVSFAMYYYSERKSLQDVYYVMGMTFGVISFIYGIILIIGSYYPETQAVKYLISR